MSKRRGRPTRQTFFAGVRFVLALAVTALFLVAPVLVLAPEHEHSRITNHMVLRGNYATITGYCTLRALS